MRYRFGALIVLVATLSIWGCSEGETTLRKTRGYLLISIDTLRADHLSSYGYRKPTSPFLDSLAERGVLFEHVVAPYPSTLTSHMTMFTGLYPAEHGVYPPDSVLAPGIPTLPGLFKRAGYRTAGFTESGFMKGRYGFSRGFDEFDDQAGHRSGDVERTLDKGIAFLEGLGAEEDFFLFLHTYAVHTPYDPPEPYRSQFWPGDAPDVFEPTGRNHVEFNSRRGELSSEGLAYHEALYDAGIRHTDAALEEFFADLEALGLARDLTVIITSDHGEEFLEHGRLAHNQVYYETVHVPLILVHPDLAGGSRVATMAATADVAPTLLAVAHIDSDHPMSGESLASPDVLAGDGPLRSAYAEDAGGRNRTLVERRGRRQLQVVRTRIPGHLGDHWLERTQSFDIGAEAFDLRLRSFEESRHVEILVDEQLAHSFELPTEWMTVRLDPGPGDASRRVDLRSASCTPARRPQRNAEDCLAFAIQASEPLERVELFDLGTDPLGSLDLARSEPSIARTILTRLARFDWVLVAEPSQEELDPELENRLRALGYL